MEKYELKSDIALVCKTVRSFPQGVKETFDSFPEVLPDCDKRTWYGISWADETGSVIYKAAANALHENEAAEMGMESFTIKKGTYHTETILDWMNKENAFGPTFMKLLDTPDLDREGACVEWYKSDDEVMCMVKVTENPVS